LFRDHAGEKWVDHGYPEYAILSFLNDQREAKEKRSHLVKEKFRATLAKVRPVLNRIALAIEEKLVKLKRKFYEKNKRLSTEIIDHQLAHEKEICAYYISTKL
jgi:hypothetical protein